MLKVLWYSQYNGHSKRDENQLILFLMSFSNVLMQKQILSV